MKTKRIKEVLVEDPAADVIHGEEREDALDDLILAAYNQSVPTFQICCS